MTWGHGVVTPYTSGSSQEFSVPELPRWALHDKDDLTDLYERVRNNASWMAHGQRPPTHDDVEVITDILAGRFPAPYDVNAESDDRADTFDRLTLEQANILSVTRLLHRVEVRGGAGSGKTVLALQQAKDLTRGSHGRPRQRVAMLCYSIGLAEHLKRQVADLGPAPPARLRRHVPRVRRSSGAPTRGTGPTASSGRSGCPSGWPSSPRSCPTGRSSTPSSSTRRRTSPTPGGPRSWSRCATRTRAASTSTPTRTSGSSPGTADRRCRWSRSSWTTTCATPSRSTSRSARSRPAACTRAAATGPTCGSSRARRRGSPRRSRRRGRPRCSTRAGSRGTSRCSPPGTGTPSRSSAADFHDQEGYWRSVLGRRRLLRPRARLQGARTARGRPLLNEDGTRDRAKERLYVGMSRATDVLVVVGDPETVRRVGGDDVAARLGVGR